MYICKKTMKVIRIQKSNLVFSVYPVKNGESTSVVIQIDKKKTRDKIVLSKEDWFKIADQVTENCFSDNV